MMKTQEPHTQTRRDGAPGLHRPGPPPTEAGSVEHPNWSSDSTTGRPAVMLDFVYVQEGIDLREEPNASETPTKESDASR